MHIDRGSGRTRPGPSEWFTGAAWIDDLAGAAQPSGLRVFRVSFAPGSRTAWHTHPVGQVLHVLSGHGRVQSRGRSIEEIGPGETAGSGPGEWHWHGATPGSFMTHLAIQGADAAGVDVVWGDQVADAEYESGERQAGG
jgi:quercetin dioxygenase-like cupin family protein